MRESTPESDVFNELAHEFAERFRRGERPSLSEYTNRYPALAAEIRDLFPTLVMMEQLGGRNDRLAESGGGQSRHMPPVPGRLGDYRILREIGRGGMGIVYEAEQETLGRHVALKVLSHHRHMEPIQLIRFQREARAAALLHHTNIVPIFGVGSHEGFHYYAMQYIHGPSLDSVLGEIKRLGRDAHRAETVRDVEPKSLTTGLASALLTLRFPAHHSPSPTNAGVASPSAPPGNSPGARRPSTEPESSPPGGSSSSLSILGRTEAQYFRNVARLGMQAAEALAYAHSHGVLHRDIKPANLLLDLQGTIWVTDFGLAKSEGAEELTSPGDVVGTLRYMAPERFQGKTDARCDVYSLGVTLYEMLTLEPAFTASHRVQLINTIMHVEATRPRKLEPLIPRDLETIVLKAIAKSPSDRFASASELARELGRFIDGRPIRSRRVSAPERLWRWSRRNPAVALLTVLAGVLTTALAITSTTAAWRFREQRDEVLEQRDSVQKQQQNTQVQLARSLLQQVRAERYSRQLRPRDERLEKLAEAAMLARSGMAGPDLLTNLRGEAIATLGEGDLRASKTWPGLNLDQAYSSFAFDADRYVGLDGGRAFHLCRISDRSEIRLVKTQSASALINPRLDPSGRFVHVVSDPSRTARIVLWDLDRGEIPAAWPHDVCDAAFRPDGGQIAALRPDGEVFVYDLPTMTEAGRCRLGLNFPPRREYARLALSRDGRLLAVMNGDTQDAWVHDLVSNRLVIHLKIPPIYRTGGVVLNSKATLLAVANDRTISVYDLADGERLSMLQGHQGGGINAYFESEGNLLFSECWDGITRVWDPIRGRLLADLPGHIRGLVGTRSQIVIGRRDDLILFQVDPGAERRTIDCRTIRERADVAVWGPEGVAFSPDGAMIAMAMRPDGVRIVRTSDGMVLAHLPIGRCNTVLFLPDGSLLTHNVRGLCRWPVSSRGDGVRRIGPPQPLARQFSVVPPYGLARSTSGRLVAISADAQKGSLLLDLERPWRRTWLKPHAEVYDVAISPDGRWAATAGGEGRPAHERVKVWDTASGQIKAEIPGLSCVAFSADGQWLGVDDRTCYRFYSTGTWAPVSRVDYEAEKTPGHGYMRFAFHPAQSIAAILGGDWSSVRLVDVTSGRVLASIEGPNESQVHRLVFSLDGRFLAVARNSQKVDLWDLSLIHRRLQELNLADGFPDIFDGEKSAGLAPPISRLEVKGADPAGLRLLAARHTVREAAYAIGRLLDAKLADAEELSLRAELWVRLGQWRLAANDYRKSLEHRPDDASTANELSWCLACEPGRGHADEAIRWARRAVALELINANFRNTLAAALYRGGRYEEAVVELERNVAQSFPGGGFDWVFLAMCRAQLGQTESARLALAKARAWGSTADRINPVQQAQFSALIREAQVVLDASLPNFPPDVFDR
jgi:serine/threonine protein kinase/WD40 repeat protein/Tfp pilus assembly protein PilF